jgi:hypothetical protein
MRRNLRWVAAGAAVICIAVAVSKTSVCIRRPGFSLNFNLLSSPCPLQLSCFVISCCYVLPSQDAKFVAADEDSKHAMRLCTGGPAAA